MTKYLALAFVLLSLSNLDSAVGLRQPRQLAEGPAPEKRVVPFRPGTAITSLLKPTDRVLVIESDLPPPMVVNPPAVSPSIELWLTSTSEFVAVIRPYDKVSVQTLTGDWVMSTVAAEIVELLKGPTSDQLHSGGRVLFSEPGGTVRVAGVEVIARVPYLEPVEVGREYLVFGGFTETGEVVVSGLNVFRIDDNNLRAQSMERSPTKHPLKDRSLDEVLNQIRQEVAKSPKGL